MKELQRVMTEASRLREKRCRLEEVLRSIDERYSASASQLEQAFNTATVQLEAEKQSALKLCESRAGKEVADYTEMKRRLESFMDPVVSWCPQGWIQNYTPNPARVNETELSALIRKIQEHGFLSWLKRTLRLGGYASRTDLAMDLWEKIADACAYCDGKISEAEEKRIHERTMTEAVINDKKQAQMQQFLDAKDALDRKKTQERDNALRTLRSFDSSEEVSALHASMAHLQTELPANEAWGVYTPPRAMPERVLLTKGCLALPDETGAESAIVFPLWIPLYESSIIVVTACGSVSSDSSEKLFVRKVLARMLKTVPPENCSYSVFDSLYKGASLGRLIDVTNIGSTDLHFDLFTSDDPRGDNVTCADRRRYLRDRPAEIIKVIAGRNPSLFAYNRNAEHFAFPFSWIVHFDFPEEPDSHLLEDLRELFVNADTAGYSFLFVTSEKGLAVLRALAGQYTKTEIFHVDCSAMRCNCGTLSVAIDNGSAPDAAQLYNFVTALKKHFDEGETVDNRIKTVLFQYGIQPRDASKRLTVPMALDSRGRPADLELGGEGSVHGFISGGTNSGKTTLLHTIILSACLHYTPDDLELWLVDYKQTEFYLYRNQTPPHIKLIGISKTPEFTFSLLDKLEEETNRRAALMNRFEVRDFADYRKHRGEPGYENLTRLFLIIDEFHEMSQFVASEMRYKDKLENILRESRAHGISFLMADQTFSTGLSGLAPAAKNQIGLRIAMRNEASPQEMRDTLEVNPALYSDSMKKTMELLNQGEFIMKVPVRNARGQLTDFKLEKFKGLYTKGEDILPISKALRKQYADRCRGQELIYVNTRDQPDWAEADLNTLDQVEKLRDSDIRLYLGQAATIRPCFGLDLGRQPDENLSVVGGTAWQRWELLAAAIKSCRYRGYKLLVFMAEYSDLMADFGNDIRELCASVPGAELMESAEEWCRKLAELDEGVSSHSRTEDTLCIFIGLEIAALEFGRLPNRNGALRNEDTFLALSRRYAMSAPDASNAETAADRPVSVQAFNALPMIEKLFASGSRYGIRCVTEVSVYRQFSKIMNIKEMCRHRVAFDMSTDDCLMFLGNGNFQKSIGQFAVYSDGGREIKKLIPYKYSR